MTSLSTTALKLTCMVLLCMVAGASFAQAAVTCGTVAKDVAPCISYLTGGSLSVGCCVGIKTLNNAARTTPDRRQACTCLKGIANSISGFNYNLAAGLPGKCGVNIPYKLSPSINCNTVN